MNSDDQKEVLSEVELICEIAEEYDVDEVYVHLKGSTYSFTAHTNHRIKFECHGHFYSIYCDDCDEKWYEEESFEDAQKRFSELLYGGDDAGDGS